MFDATKGITIGTEFEAAKWSTDPTNFVEYRNGQNEDVLIEGDEMDWLNAGAHNLALADRQAECNDELIALHQPQPMDEAMADEIWRDMLVPGQAYLNLYV